MEISRYASRLASDSRVLPSGRPPQAAPAEKIAPHPSQAGTEFVSPVASSRFLPEEPDDANLTGGTRSLSRRLLALNIPGMGKPSAFMAASRAPVAGGSVPSKPRARKVMAKSDLVKQHA
jgi:hypothetical protein